MLYMTVWAIKHRTCVNNFAYETAEINIEVKHLRKKQYFCIESPFFAPPSPKKLYHLI